MPAKTKKRKSTSTTQKRKLAARGKKIMAEAKKIRKKNPRKKWTTCVKEAGKKSRR